MPIASKKPVAAAEALMSMLASDDAEPDGGDDNGGLLKRPSAADVTDAAEEEPEEEESEEDVDQVVRRRPGGLYMKGKAGKAESTEPAAKVAKVAGTGLCKAKAKGKAKTKVAGKGKAQAKEADAGAVVPAIADADEEAISTLVANNRDVMKARKWRSMFDTATLPPHALAAYEQLKKEGIGGRVSQKSMTEFINDAIEKHVSSGGKTNFTVGVPSAPVFSGITKRIKEVAEENSAHGVILEEAVTLCGTEERFNQAVQAKRFVEGSDGLWYRPTRSVVSKELFRREENNVKKTPVADGVASANTRSIMDQMEELEASMVVPGGSLLTIANGSSGQAAVLDFGKATEKQEVMKKAIKLSNNLMGMVSANTKGDIKFATALTELKANLEEAEKLTAEVDHVRKWKKTYTGDEVDEHAVEAYAAKCESLSDRLVADMKDVRSHK